MTSSSSKLLFLLLLIVLSSSHRLVIAAATPGFDHYVLALTWPNSFCKLQPSNPHQRCMHPDEDIPQIFTIHGFWPTFSNRRSVPHSSCTASAFMLSNLNKTVLSLANMYWPDVKMSKGRKVLPGMSTSFWKHEWDYHGICSNLQQTDYMYLALTVYNTVQQAFIDLVNNHRKTGKETVDVIQFQLQLTNSLGYTPKLVCGNFVNGSSNDQYLREIQLRVKNSSPYKGISDSTFKCDTSKTFYFLTFP